MGAAKYNQSKYPLARQLLEPTLSGASYPDFLTTLAYNHIVTPEGMARL